MNKEEFEQRIVDLLVEAGYMKKEQLMTYIKINLGADSLPLVDLSFHVTDSKADMEKEVKNG